MKNPPPEWGMAMVQLATADAMVIEFVWNERFKMLQPSAQLQNLLQDKHTTKLTWGTEFTECWPEFEKLQEATDIERTKSQRDNTAPASLVDSLSHSCSTLHHDKVCITKRRMTDRFRRHQNTSVYEIEDHDFLSYAGRDALAWGPTKQAAAKQLDSVAKRLAPSMRSAIVQAPTRLASSSWKPSTGRTLEGTQSIHRNAA